VPAGKYVVLANVTVHNQSSPQTTLPVSCVIGSPTESSVPYSVRIAPFDAATAQGASIVTLTLTLTTDLPALGRLTLQCQTSTGIGGQTASATSRQLTAIKVGDLTELDLAP
jgi:hypothetical protein